MSMMHRFGLTLLGLTIAGLAAAQGYPSKPVRVVVSTVPGPLDTWARIVVEKMADRLKQPFVVENRGGAGGNIGAELVKNSPPDGHTLLFAIDTTFTVNPSLYKKLPFDPERDFAIISLPVTYVQLMAVNAANVSAKTPQELVAYAKEKRIAYASGGTGTPSHLTYAYFLSAAGADMTHIPYKGTGQSVVDVVSGQVETIFAVTNGVLPHVKSGKLRALAVSSPTRSGLLPDVPTIAELGYPGWEAAFGFAIAAPAGTPNEIVQLLAQELQRTLALPDIQERHRQSDFVPTGLDPAQSAARLRSEREKWAKVVAKAGIPAE